MPKSENEKPLGGKRENQKYKALLVAKYLMEFTDENHSCTANELIDYLKYEHGIEAERRSIYRDIAVLRDVLGMDIEGSTGGKYRLASCQFEQDDLRVLAECVHAARFISASKAKELVKTIGEFGSSYQSESLQQEVFLIDRVKTTQKGTFNIISTINHAMAKKLDGKLHAPQKISFKYMKHTIDDVNSMVEKYHGKIYKVSPYRLLINDGNYYLLAFDDKAQDMRTYRIDRMKDVKLLPDSQEGKEAFEAIDLQSYTQRVFSMFGGEKQLVAMQCENHLLDSVIDRFGTKNASYSKVDDEHFSISVEVELSNQFYSWLLQFGEKAKIMHPKEVADGMRKFLEKIITMYLPRNQ